MTPVVDPFMTTARPRYVGPELRGPADADGFRVKVGRYGDRWYHDPLPGDHIAPACDTVWPSVSTVKKASGNDWSFVALERVAKALGTEHYRNLAKWAYPDRYEALKAINKIGLNNAGKRGTNVHLGFDARLHGAPCPIGDDMPGAEYRNSIDQFFEQYNPTLVAAEFVCIHRTLNGTGYGGTADAIIELDGKKYLVDWKSRGADSDHGAYPEEAAQVCAYHGADYIIVEGRDGPERQLMPTLDGGLIVSIKPDGCRIYPVDPDKGFTHWTALHAWWVARRDEREPVGRQWPARKTVADAPTPSVSAIAGEVEACGKPPVASPAVSRMPRELAGSTGTIFEDSARLALVDARGSLATSPDEGGDWSTDEYAPLWDELKALYDGIAADQRIWRSALASQAKRRGVDFLAQGGMTERRFHINKALISFLLSGSVEDILRELLAHIIGDVALYPGVEPGHALGSLSAGEAERFAKHVDNYLAPPPAA